MKTETVESENLVPKKGSRKIALLRMNQGRINERGSHDKANRHE